MLLVQYYSYKENSKNARIHTQKTWERLKKQRVVIPIRIFVHIM
jgi:hypothetical protein